MERYIKQIVGDVMEMAAKIKFLEAKLAAAESWNAECAADAQRALDAEREKVKGLEALRVGFDGQADMVDRFDAALRAAKVEVWRDAEKEARIEAGSMNTTGDYQLACRYLAEVYNARAAKIEEGE